MDKPKEFGWYRGSTVGPDFKYLGPLGMRFPKGFNYYGTFYVDDQGTHLAFGHSEPDPVVPKTATVVEGGG